MGISWLIYAKCVEWKARCVPYKITLKQITLKESAFPATSAIKLSGLEMVQDNRNIVVLRINLNQDYKRLIFFFQKSC